MTKWEKEGWKEATPALGEDKSKREAARKSVVGGRDYYGRAGYYLRPR